LYKKAVEAASAAIKVLDHVYCSLLLVNMKSTPLGIMHLEFYKVSTLYYEKSRPSRSFSQTEATLLNFKNLGSVSSTNLLKSSHLSPASHATLNSQPLNHPKCLPDTTTKAASKTTSTSSLSSKKKLT
jgi:hypothetical protein